MVGTNNVVVGQGMGSLRLLRSLLLIMLLLSCGCSLQTSFTPPQSTWSDDSAMLVRLEQTTGYGRPSAVGSLLEQSRLQWLSGEPDNALVILHRALRISPDDALVYYYMAMMQSALGERHEASQLARRSLTLTDAPLLREQVRLFLDKLDRSTAPVLQDDLSRV